MKAVTPAACEGTDSSCPGRRRRTTRNTSRKRGREPRAFSDVGAVGCEARLDDFDCDFCIIVHGLRLRYTNLEFLGNFVFVFLFLTSKMGDAFDTPCEIVYDGLCLYGGGWVCSGLNEMSGKFTLERWMRYR